MVVDNNTTDPVPSKDELVEIRSPYRPYPLGAKKDLRAAVDHVEYDPDDSRVAYVSDIPADDLIEEWELEVVRTDSPEEVWKTTHGERIEIYTDRVLHDGREVSISPDEAKKQVRDQDHFSRLLDEDS